MVKVLLIISLSTGDRGAYSEPFSDVVVVVDVVADVVVTE